MGAREVEVCSPCPLGPKTSWQRHSICTQNHQRIKLDLIQCQVNMSFFCLCMCTIWTEFPFLIALRESFCPALLMYLLVKHSFIHCQCNMSSLPNSVLGAGEVSIQLAVSKPTVQPEVKEREVRTQPSRHWSHCRSEIACTIGCKSCFASRF